MYTNTNNNWMIYGFPNMNNMNMGNYGMNGNIYGGNNFWEMAYGQQNYFTQNFNQMNQQQYMPNKYNINFKTTGGVKVLVNVDVGTSISDTLLLFLKRVGKPELFDVNSGIFFLCNAQKLNIYDRSPIQSLSMDGGTNLIIMVNDVQNLIGA